MRMGRCLGAAVAVLAGITIPCAAETVPAAAFLGMAITTGISTSSDGLIELDGIHNAIWAQTLPVSENLHVYTRWSGTGVHTVDVKIVERSTDTSLGETTDRLDFGDTPVTWFTHDFNPAKFESAGVYAVEVVLDDQPVAAYALYVNAEDQLPEDPAFVLSVPAGTGMLDRQGRAKVSGIFDYLAFPSFPARDSFSIVTVWFSGDGRFAHSVDITGPDGSMVARSAPLTLTATHGGMSVAANAFESVQFPSAGVYTATIYLQGNKVLSYPLVIRERPPGAAAN